MKRLLSLILIMCFTVSLGSCALKPDDRFTVGVLGTADTLDPQKADCDSEIIAAVNCFEGLFRINEAGLTDPAGAISYTVSADRLTYTFILNPDAVWHITENALKLFGNRDFSVSVTAADYAFALKRAIIEKLPETEKLLNIAGAKEAYEGTAAAEKIGVKATSDFTLEIKLTEPDSSFTASLAKPVSFPLSEVFFTAAGKNYGKSPDTMIFNGPYAVTEFGSSSEILFTENTDYEGRVKVKNSGVELVPTGNRDSLLPRFTDGVYDCYLGSSLDNLPASFKPVTCSETIWGLVANLESGIMLNQNIRKALIYASDTSLLCGKFGSDASGIVGNSRLVSIHNYSVFTHEAPTFEFNTEKAKKLWKEGIKQLKSSPLTIRVSVPAALEKTFVLITDKWSESFGEEIQYEISVFNPDDAPAVKEAGEYELAFLPASSNDVTALSVLRQFDLSKIQDIGKAYNGLLADIASSTNEKEQAEKISEAETLLTNSGIFVPLSTQSVNLYLAEGVNGIYAAGAAVTMGYIYFESGEKL